MSSDRHMLDERYGYTESTPGGETSVVNCMERVPADAPLEEEDISFVSETGNGITAYELAPGCMRCTDPVEIATRISAALPVTTPHNTAVYVLLDDALPDGAANASFTVLVVGSGSTDPGRELRIAQIKTARAAAAERKDETKSRVNGKPMTVSQIFLAQQPLVQHSKMYRQRIAELALSAIGVDIDSHLLCPPQDACIRQMLQRPNDSSVCLLHDYYPRGTETMWRIQCSEESATLYRREEHVAVCACASPCNQGHPVYDFRRSGCEDEAKNENYRLDPREHVVVAGQPMCSFPEHDGLCAVEASDAGMTRFVPAAALVSNYVAPRPLDVAQGLAGYRSAHFRIVASVLGSPMAPNGKLYGRIAVDRDVCIAHTVDSPGAQIVVPNTAQWLQWLHEMSPDRSALYFLGHGATEVIKSPDGKMVTAYRISRALLASLHCGEAEND